MLYCCGLTELGMLLLAASRESEGFNAFKQAHTNLSFGLTSTNDTESADPNSGKRFDVCETGGEER